MPLKRPPHGLFFGIMILFSLLAAGCGLRPPEAAVRVVAEESETASPSPAPTPEVLYTVEFRSGEELLSRQELSPGGLPEVPALEGVRLLGWTDESGERISPEEIPVSGNAVYRALVRPILREDAPFLFADEQGRLRPADPFTREDAALALGALCPEAAEGILPPPTEDTADEPLPREEFLTLLDALFDPLATSALMNAVLPEGSACLTRAEAVNILSGLMGPIEVPEGAYYPDAGPYTWGREALLRAAGPSTLTPEALRSRTKDGFLWIEGYLYALDEEGYFLIEEYNGLTFDGNGRFTSGDAVLDRYVAETLTNYIQPDVPRLEDLRAVYYHVKNDFQYLTRNYYASGETGWENQEALTLFETGKGNCYCYAGVFRSLARGLGYNAVCYSGTMGNQDQPHAWTEIIQEDGRVFICDPEIEMNYWWVAGLKNDPSMYTDNFMMPVEKSAGWNYQAAGRTVYYN